jgi:Flp pilus assembly protein TadB
MKKNIFLFCIVILVSTVILSELVNVWIKMFNLIALLAIAWLDGATREAERALKQLRELNEEMKKCLTSSKP